MPLALEIRRLSQADRCQDFRSGNDDLDKFLCTHAKENEHRRRTATSVACVEGRIVGFVTIVPNSVPTEPLKDHLKRLANFPAPVLMLARMATDKRFQGQGIGAQLLRDVVFPRAVDLADGFGAVGIYVDPKPEAVAFYAKYGFVALSVEAVPPPMFVAVDTVRTAIAGK